MWHIIWSENSITKLHLFRQKTLNPSQVLPSKVDPRTERVNYLYSLYLYNLHVQSHVVRPYNAFFVKRRSECKLNPLYFLNLIIINNRISFRVFVTLFSAHMRYILFWKTLRPILLIHCNGCLPTFQNDLFLENCVATFHKSQTNIIDTKTTWHYIKFT